MSLEDDSLEGSVIQKHLVIKESKSKYKSDVETRFISNPEGRFLIDKPLFDLFKKSNKWRSVADIVETTGMAERTVQYTCRRFIKHEIFEESNVTKVGVYHKYKNRHPDTRLYRLANKSKNGTRRNKKKV